MFRITLLTLATTLSCFAATREVAHLFIVDPSERGLGVIDNDGVYQIPSCDVPTTLPSEHAITQHLGTLSGATCNPDSLMLMMRIECTQAEAPTSLFGWLAQLFKPQSSPELETATDKAIHYFYLIRSNAHETKDFPLIQWLDIPTLYATEGSSTHRCVEPQETIEVLKLLTKFKSGNKMETRDGAALKQFFEEKGIDADVEIFIPAAVIDAHFKSRGDLKAARVERQTKNNDFETLLLLPAIPFIMFNILKKY